MSRLRSGALLAVVLLFGSGCGTIGSLMEGTLEGERTLVYGGVQVDAVIVGNMFSGENVHGVNVFWIALLYFFDLPLSLVADTITLPVTLAVELCGPPAKPGGEKSPPKSDPK